MVKIVLTLLLILSTWYVRAQNDDATRRNNKALIQLSSAFVTVAKEATIDLDSSLVITTKFHNLSRSGVISDGIDDGYAEKFCRWIDDRNTRIPQADILKLNGRPKARLMLLLGAYYAFQPGLKQSDIDSSIYWVRMAEKENLRFKDARWVYQAYCLLGKCYLKSGKLKKAAFFFNKITSSPHLCDSDIVAKAWNYRGMYSPFRPSTTDRRIQCLMKAATLFSQLRDTENVFNVLTNIAYLNFARQNLNEAERAAFLSYRLQLNSKFPYTHYTSDLISLIQGVKGDYVGQLKYALQSIEAADRSRDHLGLAIFYARAGDAYAADAAKRGEAANWYRKALAEFIKNNDAAHAYKLLYHFNNEDLGKPGNDSLLNLLNTLIISHPPQNSIDQQDAFIALGEGYRKLKQFKKAEYYYLKAEHLMSVNQKIRGNIHNPELIFLLGQFYFYAGIHQKSRNYLITLIKDPEAGKQSAGNLSEAYWLLHQIDSDRGRYATSMYFLKEHNRLKDSLHRFVEHTRSAIDRSNGKMIGGVTEIRNISGQKKARTIVIVSSILALLLIGIGGTFIYRFQTRIRKQSKDDYRKRLLEKTALDTKKLRKSKEKLIKEIHHRVQNNLKIVIDLLSRQSAFITDHDALEAIEQSQSRMMAMSLIHQELDTAEGAADVGLATFISKMVVFLTEHYNKKAKYIKFNLKLSQINISFSQAVPLALIINEALTNSIKHAFLFQEQAEITVELLGLTDGRVKLTMKDNGSGLPDNFDVGVSQTLGFNLILGLASQIDAIPVFRNQQGLTVDIVFELKPESEKFL